MGFEPVREQPAIPRCSRSNLEHYHSDYHRCCHHRNSHHHRSYHNRRHDYYNQDHPRTYLHQHIRPFLLYPCILLPRFER